MTLEEQKKIQERKMKSQINIQYLNNEFQVVHNPDASFSGYAVRTEKNTLSNIKEFDNGMEVGIISFRPTRLPTINVARSHNYFEERYINGNISLQYTFYKDVLCGEYIKYNIYGSVLLREFYSGDGECTDEIKQFIGFTGSDEEFKNYQFKEDEEFNILMRYGSHFKLIKEIEKKSQYFDYVFENCYKK